MILVLALAAGLWFGGGLLGAPRELRLAMIGALLAGVIAGHVMLPQSHPLRLATGRDAAPWVALLFLGGLVAVWRQGLAWLRARAVPVEAAPAAGTFRTEELKRYARHVALREIGGAGQKRLKAARVLVVGAGGLGSPVCLYLAAAGVGTVGVIDDDVVEATNLQRQIIHADQRLGMPKVFSAQTGMKAVNPFVTVRPYNRRLTAEVAESLFGDYDLVLDGSDNFETRELVNAGCVARGVPLIAGSLAQWEGQVSLYHPPAGPCLHCVFPVRPAPGMVPTCAEAGVAAPLPGVIGSLMALEAVKHLAGAGETLRGRLMLYDGLYGEVRVVEIKRNPDCPVCGGRGALTL
jgi:molybdopterin/thiamine biosynthesis adenylyltransferase